MDMAAKKGYVRAKYRGCDRYAINHFFWMHSRVARGKGISTAFPRTREGYIAFCMELGPIPDGMKRPSVGRRDHAIGYVVGNIKWEEYNYNSRKRYANQERFRKLEEQRIKEEIDDIPF